MSGPLKLGTLLSLLLQLASVLEFALELSPVNGPFGSTLSVLRAFRLLRLFRLASSWRSLQRIIATLMLSVTSAGYLTLLLLLFLFIDALLGMQLFGYKVDCAPLLKHYQLLACCVQLGAACLCLTPVLCPLLYRLLCVTQSLVHTSYVHLGCHHWMSARLTQTAMWTVMPAKPAHGLT
jgi:hypothetical protein